MIRDIAEKTARQMMMSEYRHHLYHEEELHLSDELFRLDREALVKLLNSDSMEYAIGRYLDVLGPTLLRAMKNSLICFIVPLCRSAIQMGLNSELSFALSDFYINYLESLNNLAAVKALFSEITLHYYDLVHVEQSESYSRPVSQAIQYIRRNLYSRFTVEEVAQSVHLDRHYFTSLFTGQTGITPAKYITQKKLEEGHRLLLHTDSPVSEIAESLGFYDTAHFSKRFKEYYGITPSKLKP